MAHLMGMTLAALLVSANAIGHEYYADGFVIIHPWAVPTAAGVTDAPVYFHLDEVSKGDRLISGFHRLPTGWNFERTTGL